jgi:hypothetical protein
MRLVDDLGVRVSEKERTMLGRVWDTLFGALPNKRLAFEADRVIYEAAGKAGVTPEKVERFKYELHKIVEDNTHQYPGGFQRSKYVSIFTIEPSTINKVAQRVGMGEAPAGFKSWSEVVFRAYPGPMKIAQQQVLGKSLAIPYSERYHYLTRTMYPMLRFYFSPRFLLMNLTERSILGYAKGGPDYFKEADPRLRRLADGLRLTRGWRTPRTSTSATTLGRSRAWRWLCGATRSRRLSPRSCRRTASCSRRCETRE